MSRLLRPRTVIPGAAGLLLMLSPPLARAQQSVAQDQNLDPTSPMAPLPDLGVAWPDLSTGNAIDPALDAIATPEVDEARYSYRITGIDAVDNKLVDERFRALSTLRANDDDPANLAQIDRRAREDAKLLTDLLRAAGYYDARVSTSVERQGAALVVVLAATAGTRYRLADIDLGGIAAAGPKSDALRKSFGVASGDPVDADAITAGEDKLRSAAGERGFPFAKIGEPSLVVDHETKTATLALPVAPGGDRRFGRILTDGDTVFDAEHVQDIARFAPGDSYNAVEVDDLRRAIIQTGLVSSVRVRPVEGQTPETVDLNVRMLPAPPRTIAGELGYGTGEGARSEVSWTHRNLFPPEGALTLRGVLGTREQLGSVVFRRNNFQGRDRVLTAQVSAAHLERNAYEANTFQLSGSLERQTNIFFQKAWTWSIGAELVASDERDVIVTTGEPRRRTFFIGALPTSLNYDGSDDLLDPTRGFRLGGRISPELSLSGSAFAYSRFQLDASAYYPIREGVVIAGRTRLGSIAGAPRDAIAPSRRFYAGGGASVRGYGYQDIGPRDPNNDPIGGRSLAEFSIEARIRSFGNFGVVPFFDGGNIYTAALPDFSGFRYGAGLGVRYYSNFGPIRIDVGTPLNPQPDDPRIAVYVSLGQAF